MDTANTDLNALHEAFVRLSNEFEPIQRLLKKLDLDNKRLHEAIARSAEELVGANADANRQIAREEARQEILLILEKHQGRYEPGGFTHNFLTAVIKEFQE